MRYRACKELGHGKIPCKVLDPSTTVEKLREYTTKDNVAFGENDWDLLANEWESEELKEWGLDIWGSEDVIHLDEFFEEDTKQKEDNKNKIILEYTEEDYKKVIEAFKSHSGTKENILFKLLGL